MADVNDWNTVDANNNATPPDGWPENMSYSEVNNAGRQVQGAVKRMWSDVNGSLAAGGAVNAFTVTLNSAYTSYFDGMFFACSVPSQNTGGVTLNVNGIGARTVQVNGSALTGGELKAGAVYLFHYDGTNFQVLNSGTGGVIDQSTMTNTSAPDLVDTDVALRVGATDPDVAQHLEFGPAQVQSKSDATTAAALSVNALGGALVLGSQSAVVLGNVQLYGGDGGGNVAVALETTVNGVLVEGAATESAVEINAVGGGLAGRLAFDGTDLSLSGSATSAEILLEATNAATATRRLARLDPDGFLDFHFPPKATTGSDGIGMRIVSAGIEVRGSTNATVSSFGIVDMLLQLASNDGNVFAQVGFNGSRLQLASFAYGANTILLGTDAGGTLVDLMELDPDGGIDFNYDGALGMSLQSAGVLDIVGDQNTDTDARLVEFSHQNRTRRAVIGHNSDDILLIQNEVHGGIVRVRAEQTGSGALRTMAEFDPDAGATLFYDAAICARTIAQTSGGLEVVNLLTGAGFERVLTESDLPSGGGSGNTDTTPAVKTADTSRASTTTLTDDPHLSLTLDGTSYYQIEAMLLVDNAGSVSGIQTGINFTAGGVVDVAWEYVNHSSALNGAAVNGRSAQTLPIEGANLGTGDRTIIRMTGFLYFSSGAADSRTATIQWAQETSDAANAVIKQGSWFKAIKIADF